MALSEWQPVTVALTSFFVYIACFFNILTSCCFWAWFSYCSCTHLDVKLVRLLCFSISIFCGLLNSVNQHIQLQEQTSVQTLHSICCHRKCEVSPKQDGRASCADKAIAGVQPDTLYRDLADLKAQKGDSNTW